MISTHQYSAAHPSTENKVFLAAYSQISPKQRRNFMAVGGYDGMAAVHQVIRQLNGNIDGDKGMEVLKGMKLNSPRGPIQIDAETRDIVKTFTCAKSRRSMASCITPSSKPLPQSRIRASDRALMIVPFGIK